MSLPEVDALPAHVRRLVIDLLEQHRPLRRPDTDAFREQFLVWCPACDNNHVRVWRPGDPPYSCSFWREALDWGLVEDGRQD